MLRLCIQLIAQPSTAPPQCSPSSAFGGSQSTELAVEVQSQTVSGWHVSLDTQSRCDVCVVHVTGTAEPKH